MQTALCLKHKQMHNDTSTFSYACGPYSGNALSPPATAVQQQYVSAKLADGLGTEYRIVKLN